MDGSLLACGNVAGRENWKGSGFHADVVIERVLARLVATRDAERVGGAAPELPDYWIEHAAGADGPDWDVVERRGDQFVLDELKSGKVAAAERRAMWMRVRRTCATTSVTAVTLRLTADRDRVKLMSAWRALAMAAPPARPPMRPPPKVTSARHLLAEAIAYLTHRDPRFGTKKTKKVPVDVGPPLALADAIELLERFEFVADRAHAEVRQQISTLLRELRSRTTAEVLQTWLLGHFFEVAQASGVIQPVRLAAALPLVGAVLQLEPDLDRLVERIFAGEPAPTRTSRLPLRRWREAQPRIAREIDRVAATDDGAFLVLTGEAGLGKSVVLAGMFAELKERGEQVAWLSLGHDGGPIPTADQIARMTHLLSQRTAWSRQPCWLLVDGIDGEPDFLRFLTPGDKLRVAVAARTESYEPRRQFTATEVPLTRWSAEEVVAEFDDGVPQDLVALLGNPFLLSLALEIPGDTVRRPTRYAVLSRYLTEVVFASGVEGVAARACFEVMARGLVRGETWTIPATSGLQRLLERGVATAPGGGRVRFEHQLFGEMATAMWVAHRDARVCVRRFARIRDSFVRASALRLLLDGCVDVGDSTRLVDLPEVGAFLSAGLDGGVDLVGGLASLDVVAPELLQHPRSSDFGAPLFEAAKLADSRSWLKAIALLHVEQRPAWATAVARTDALPQIAEHLAACGDTLAVEVRRAVAIRLRAWSLGERSLWTSYLVDVVAAELPDDETLDWMASIMAPDRPWIVGWLRSGLRRICARNADLDPARVRRAVETVISAARPEDSERFDDAFDLLLGDPGERGLLETQPEIAIEMVLAWQDAEARRDREGRAQWRDELNAVAATFDVEASDADASEEKEPWSVDDLLDDDPLGRPGGGVLSIVWTHLHQHLHDGNVHVSAAFCAAVRRERRTAAMLVAMHVAPVATGELAALVDELLATKPLLYAHYRGSKLVATAIEARWEQLDERHRTAVVANIEAVDVASPSFAEMRALIGAIPVGDRPPTLAARLADISGPRPAADVVLERDPAEAEPAGAQHSLAEQMAEVPAWLDLEPIPWKRVSSVLVEDEHAQRVDASVRPVRLLTAETARRCAEAAFEALPAIAQAIAPRRDVVHVADISVALPPHHEDDALNAQLVEALRASLLAPHIDVSFAVHTLTFVRPWHWRHDRGSQLLLDIVGDVEDPSIVSAALEKLLYSEQALLQALGTLTDRTRTTSDHSVAKEMGQIMGARAPWSSAFADVLRGWLLSPPTGRFLAAATAWNAFLSGAAFALKEEAHHEPQLEPALYGELARALWAAWQAPGAQSGKERRGLALFLMSPLHRAPRAKALALAGRYWADLRSLLEEILASGGDEEVSGALFHLDLGALAAPALDDLASMLCKAAIARFTEPAEGTREGPRRAAQILRDIGLLEACTRAMASTIHQTLIAIGARKESLDVERRWAACG